MIGNDHEHSMNERQQAHGNASVAAIIEEREKPLVETAERPDTEDDVQQDKCSSSECTHQQNLISNQRKNHFGDHTEQDQKCSHTSGEDEIVDLLLAIQLNGGVFEAHISRTLSVGV